MPVLERDDVAKLDAKQVERKMRERREELSSLRDKHDGNIATITDEADSERVRELASDLNILGERFDEARALERAEDNFVRLTEYLEQPDPSKGHPGHGKVRELRKGQTRDIGGLFLESEAFKAYKDNGDLDRVSTHAIEGLWPGYRGIGEVPTDGVQLQAALFDSADFPIQPDFITQPVETLYQPNNIGPLMAQGTTNTNTIRYPVETVTATGAAEIAEAGTKPEADITFAPVDEPVRKIAVTLPLTDEALDDVPFLRAYINARLRLFVQMREDLQLLSGNGTAPNIRGILNRSGINTATTYSIAGANPDQALIDGVFAASMRVYEAFLVPDNVVMRPATWQIAALAKDAQRNYLLGGPGAVGYAGAGPGQPRLWGLPVVLNGNMPAQSAGNKVALVGAFRSAAMVIRRSGIDLAVSDSHSTFFVENKVMLRAEERLALAVFRPAGFATVTSNA